MARFPLGQRTELGAGGALVGPGQQLGRQIREGPGHEGTGDPRVHSGMAHAVEVTGIEPRVRDKVPQPLGHLGLAAEAHRNQRAADRQIALCPSVHEHGLGHSSQRATRTSRQAGQGTRRSQQTGRGAAQLFHAGHDHGRVGRLMFAHQAELHDRPLSQVCCDFDVSGKPG